MTDAYDKIPESRKNSYRLVQFFTTLGSFGGQAYYSGDLVSSIGLGVLGFLGSSVACAGVESIAAYRDGTYKEWKEAREYE